MVALTATIRDRILVNHRVPLDEVARHLPSGLVPAVVDGAGMGGRCLLWVTDLRPVGLPVPGVAVRSAAERWLVHHVDDPEQLAVFVPRRVTSSWLGPLLGARFGAGGQERGSIRWEQGAVGAHVRAVDAAGREVAVRVGGAPANHVRPPTAMQALHAAATVGWSLDHRGLLRASSLTTSGTVAPVAVRDLRDDDARFSQHPVDHVVRVKDVQMRWEPADVPARGRSGQVVAGR